MIEDRPKLVIDVNKHGIRREMPAGGYKSAKNKKRGNKEGNSYKGKVQHKDNLSRQSNSRVSAK